MQQIVSQWRTIRLLSSHAVDHPCLQPAVDPGSLDPIGGVSGGGNEPGAESSGEMSAAMAPDDKPRFPGLSWWRALMSRWRREDRESYVCYALMVRR